MADDLGDLSEVVNDRTLVLNLIRGLNERFANIGLHLRRSHLFPSFLEAKDALRLEELTFVHHDTTPTALVAGSSLASARPPAQAPAGCGHTSGGEFAASGGVLAPKNHRSKRSGKKTTFSGQGGGQPNSKAGQGSGGLP